MVFGPGSHIMRCWIKMVWLGCTNAPAALEDILQWARLGPRASRVDHLTSAAAEPDPSITTFERRPSA